MAQFKIQCIIVDIGLTWKYWYEVIDSTDTHYMVEDDYGVYTWYARELFKQ